MSEARPFRDVKLQWLQQLSCDKDLSDSARSVALYIITTHLNGHTEKLWPSYQTIADATGKSVKTIQRAVRELEVKGWFEVQRGNGVGHNTEYRPSLDYIRQAHLVRDIEVIAEGLFRPEGGNGAHFAEMAKSMIAAVIEVVMTRRTEANRNLVTVMDLLFSASFEKTLIGTRGISCSSAVAGL
ncbi:helix-turn-helix domain-containing protein [Rhizobium terrae]|uniref:helix-turn-helix domain-containing protein n=1 Tax=Rhizobium terrae TaxID=2171756 RepID=UPI001D00D7FA|nr:helix-turn-helix domain-containing protein [Rhizobium terrae]